MVSHACAHDAAAATSTPWSLRARRTVHSLLATGALIAIGQAGFGVAAAQANPVCDVAGAVTGALGGMVCDLAGKGAGAAANAAVGGTFDKIVSSLLEGYQTMLLWGLSWWIKLPTPALDNTTGLMQEIHDHTLALQILGLTFSLMFFGFRMMIDRSRSLVDDTEDGFKILIRSGLAVSAIPLMLTIGGQIADGISNWLLGEAIGDNNGDIIKNFLMLDVLTGSGGGLASAALGIIALFGFLGALLQLILLVVREAMLLIVVGVLPIAASFSGTGPGSQTYQRLISWSLAFLLFKPVGALCYFIAFKGAQQKDNPQQVVLGMVLLALVGFVLPALLRLITPAVGSMGAGGSGAAAAGATVGAVAAGASLAATVGSGGAAGGASIATSSIASRSGQSSVSGSMTSASNTSSAQRSPPPSMGPGPNPAMSGGDGGRPSSSGAESSGKSGGPVKAMSGAGQVATMAGAGAQTVTSGIQSEAEATGPDVSTQPSMQSGWGENAMSR